MTTCLLVRGRADGPLARSVLGGASHRAGCRATLPWAPENTRLVGIKCGLARLAQVGYKAVAVEGGAPLDLERTPLADGPLAGLLLVLLFLTLHF